MNTTEKGSLTSADPFCVNVIQTQYQTAAQTLNVESVKQSFKCTGKNNVALLCTQLNS